MSKITKDFLFELGTEELPPKALKKLSQSLLQNVERQLKEIKVGFGETKWFASPRRLSFVIKGLAESQEDIIIEKQGPLVSIAYKDGEPTKVGLGFAKSCGVELDQLSRVETVKGDKLFYSSKEPGQMTIKLLQDIIVKSLKQLPIPKMMRWGSSPFEFVRPVHWVLAMYGTDIVDIEVLGHKASNITYGHRFHCPDKIIVENVDSYLNSLSEAMVFADWDQRKQMVVNQSETLAKKNGYKVVLDNDLVEEVCAIVEYPNAMLCEFNEEFLRVPQEALVSSMEEHQKCFALLDKDGSLVSNFITISNIKSKKPELVTLGNQKVMNARLADAAFFYDTDLKKSLEVLLPKLENVTFQNKLGNMYQKAQRIANTSQQLAELSNVNPQQASRAGLLAKADLISDMVFEFTDLQGIIGKYYAKAHGEDDVVAQAIEQQYWPKYSGAELPNNDVAACVALAEKLDTLVGIFGIGQKPTGNKDPFALRRSAIGILRILRDTNIDISMETVVDIALQSYKKINDLEFGSEVKTEVVDFCLDRLKNLYKEEGVSVEKFEAVNSTNYSSIKDFAARIAAVDNFSNTKKSQNLIASNKRVKNILNKSMAESKQHYDLKFAKAAGNEYELALAYSIEEITPDIKKYIQNHEYGYALELLSSLDRVISEFFDNVMVMDNNESVRKNRIALLADLYKLFVDVADISKL